MPSKQQLEDELSQLSIADERRFRRRLAKARSPKALAAIAADMMTARENVDKRAGSIPAITYPEQLPVSARKDDIADAIRDHQVVIIAGETGSGKTTLLHSRSGLTPIDCGDIFIGEHRITSKDAFSRRKRRRDAVTRPAPNGGSFFRR